VLECWSIGVLEYWSVGVLECWSVGVSVPVLQYSSTPALQHSSDMKQNKPGTALITGASSGIGEAFARKLAAQGYDLILVARRQKRLEALAQELKHSYSVIVEIVVADLAKKQDITRVENHIRKTEDLDILINNAGFGTPGAFADIAIEKTINMINVHVIASTRFTWMALQGMLTRNRGTIIYVSSMAAFLPFPTAVNYCSTKAYLNMFSESLQNQLKDTNITVQALCPGFIYTEFHDTEEYKDFDRTMIPEWLWMTSDEVVEQSLNALSRNRKKVIFIPGVKNRILVWLMKNTMTSCIFRKVMARKKEEFRKK
jgi:short-subunit dehydrogenase